MKSFLTMFIALSAINTDLYAAEAGMPQLDPTYWASQGFWLILIFTILYISISKFYLPKIKDNLDNRENKIKEDLENANKFKEQSEAKLKEYEIILENATIEDKGALMTSWKCFQIKEFKTIAEWVIKLILNSKRDVYSPIPLSLELSDLWGQLYNTGDFQVPHDHLPHHWSFVYYVNTPMGSSPLVFEQSGQKIYPKEGEVIFFPAWVRHFVPTNDCKERSIIAGNFYSYYK